MPTEILFDVFVGGKVQTDTRNSTDHDGSHSLIEGAPSLELKSLPYNLPGRVRGGLDPAFDSIYVSINP